MLQSDWVANSLRAHAQESSLIRIAIGGSIKRCDLSSDSILIGGELHTYQTHASVSE